MTLGRAAVIVCSEDVVGMLQSCCRSVDVEVKTVADLHLQLSNDSRLAGGHSRLALIPKALICTVTCSTLPIDVEICEVRCEPSPT